MLNLDQSAWSRPTWLASALFALIALGCSDEASAPRKSPELPGKCAEEALLVLKPGPHGVTLTRSFASNVAPTIRLEVADSDVELTNRVTLSDCDGTAKKELTFTGSGSFAVVSAGDWPSELTTASCIDVAATSGHADSVDAAAYAKIHRGDFRIVGSLTLPKGTTVSPALSEALVDVGNTTRAAQVRADGSFEITNVAPGLVKSVRAALRSRDTVLVGESYPVFLLDAAHPTRNVSVTLAGAISPRDALEPDDSIAQLANRPSLALRTPEEHVLPSKSDTDLIPFDATAGHSYRASVSPIGDAADFSVALVDATGSVLEEANTTPGEFAESPSLSWKAPSTGRFYARVSRNDDVAKIARFSIELDVVSIH
jgi:hypothetical protein